MVDTTGIRRAGDERKAQGWPSSLPVRLLALAGAGVLLPFAVRLWGLGDYGFWYDEGFSATVAALPLEGIVATVYSDVHPPLYYFFLKCWMALAGNGEFALRYLSLAAGVLTVVLTAKLAHILGEGRAASATGTLAALSPLLVAYAREARMYVLAGLWVTLAACLLLLALRRPRRGLWAAFALAEAAALWTHYYTGLVLVALGLAALVALLWRRQRPKAQVAGWALAQAFVLASVAPLVGPALARLGVYGSDFVSPPSAPEIVLAAVRGLNLGLRPAAGDETLPLLAAGAAVAFAAVAGLANHKTRAGTAFALLWLALATLPVLYLGGQRGAFHPRYLVQVAPAYCLLAGLGLGLSGRWLAPATVAAAAVAAVFAFGLPSGSATAREDAGSVARYLASVATEHDVILVDTDQPFRYYATRSPAPYLILPDDYPGDQNLRAWLDRASPGRERIYHLQWLASFYDPREVIKFYLRSQTEWVGERRFAGFVVDEYRLPSSYAFSPPVFTPTGHSFGGSLDLAGVELSPGRDVLERVEKPTVVGNGLLPVVLNWRLRGQLGFDVGAGLALYDERGWSVSSVARPVVNAAHVYTARWRLGEEAANYYLLPIPLGTLPGEYTIRAFVYREGTTQRLDLLDTAGRPQGTEAEVGRVKVVSPLAAGRSVPEPPVTLADLAELSLVSATLDRNEVAQGERLTVDFEWWARARPAADYRLDLSMVAFDGTQPAASSLVEIGEGRYPTSTWPRGERARDRASLLVPGRAPAGAYTVLASLLSPSGQVFGAVAIGKVTVNEIRREMAVPAVPRARAALFGGVVELLGFDVDAERLEAGKPLGVTLYWRAAGETDVDYTVFTQLLGPGDVVWGQHDRPPLDGRRPTTGWLKGEVLVDRYAPALRPGAPPGEYVLQVGLYDPKTMRRLPVVDAQGREVDSRVVLMRLNLAP